jgi:hypothetical protein
VALVRARRRMVCLTIVADVVAFAVPAATAKASRLRPALLGFARSSLARVFADLLGDLDPIPQV